MAAQWYPGTRFAKRGVAPAALSATSGTSLARRPAQSLSYQLQEHFMSLKLLVSATAAALFAMGAMAQTSSSPSGSMGSDSNVGGSTSGSAGSSTGSIGGGTSGSATGGAGASSPRCATLTGLEKDRCLREEGNVSGAGGTSGSTSSGVGTSGSLGGGLGTGTGSSTSGGTGGASSSGTGAGK
jgi:hypothetical protein